MIIATMSQPTERRVTIELGERQAELLKLVAQHNITVPAKLLQQNRKLEAKREDFEDTLTALFDALSHAGVRNVG